jgi:hypothetical protein
MDRKTEKREKGNTHCRTWKMARNSENVKKEKCTM